MTPEMEALGRRVVACKGWDWARPWCLLPDDKGRTFRRNWCPDDPGFGFTQVNGPVLRCPRDKAQALPDFRDPGSLGSLLALVREAWHDPHLCTLCVVDEEGAESWEVWTPARWGSLRRGGGPTEAHALVDALERAPKCGEARS